MKLSPWILCTCLASLFSFIKRTLFRFRRRRSSDPGPGLPTKAPVGLPGTNTAGPALIPVPIPSGNCPQTHTQTQSLPFESTPRQNNSGVELDWDDWDDGQSMSIKIDPTSPSVIGGNYGNSHLPPSSLDPSQEDEEPEVDYFTDMMPSYKKPAQIRKKTQVIGGPSPLTQGLTNRLTMGVDETAVLMDELGTWTENTNGWEEETGDDLAWEAEQVIREKKMAERERRAAEQRRKKMEKDAQRSARKDTGKLATKLK